MAELKLIDSLHWKHLNIQRNGNSPFLCLFQQIPGFGSPQLRIKDIAGHI